MAAWAGVLMLPEQGAVPPWELPADVTFELVRCQTQDQVDDVFIGTSAGGRIFVQAKHGLDWSTSATSELAKALDQFVRQYLACRGGGRGGPLARTQDRLLLAVDPTSSGTVRHRLRAVLKSLRDLGVQQTLADAVLTQADQDLLRELREHVRRSWVEATGDQPTEADERDILGLMWVGELDVDGDGREAGQARGLLCSAILADPTRDDVVWRIVKDWFKERAEIRSGADRARLRTELEQLGMPLQAVPSYRADIERLRASSRDTLAAVAEFAVLHVGADVPVKIARDCTTAIVAAVESGSVVVVGEPGAGKSGALHDVVEELVRTGRDVLFIAVGRINAQTVPSLLSEFHLDHELLDVLANWPGAEPAVLAIDALDAARSEQAAQMLRELIARVPSAAPRWHVLASIRKFDLRHSPRLQQQFHGVPLAEFADHEFHQVRHVNVPPLTADELVQVGRQSAALADIASREGPIKDLLTVPFNLRLIADLLGQGVPVDDLTPIRTQLELLDRYWAERVISGGERGYAREYLLTRLVEEMVRGRVLRADWRSAADVSASSALHDLLSAHVLIEWQPDPTSAPDRFILTFGHHILFDYAVQLLLLREPATLAARLVADHELVVSIRPSLVMRFEEAWERDPSRRRFWSLVLAILQEQIPEIGKLVGPEVAANAARAVADFDALFRMLGASHQTTQRAAAMAVTHVVGTLLARPNVPADLLNGTDHWCAFIERASREAVAPIPGAVATFLNTACDQPDLLSAGQLYLLGSAARRLLSFAWSGTNPNTGLAIVGIKAVCRTYASAPAASRAILQRGLESVHLAAYGHQELLWLAGEVPRLITLDPDLVEEIYTAAFGYENLSDEVTTMGASQLLGLHSTERQDYGMGLYRLTEAFPAFLERAPLAATRCLILALETYVANHHPAPSGEVIEHGLDLDGRVAHLRIDYSSTWEQGAFARDNPMALLDAFTRHLRRVASDPARVDERRGIVGLVVERNRQAVLWRRLLVVAREAPATLGRDLLPLARAEPILVGLDTSTAAGDYIVSLFPHLDAEDRARVEQAILALTGSGPKDEEPLRAHLRDRLLGCLEPSLVVTDAARARLEELRAEGGPPANTPLFSFHSWSRPYGEREHLADRGVAVDSPANRRIQALEEPVTAFTAKHLNSAPTGAQVSEILPAIQALYSAVQTTKADGVDPAQADYAWDCLAGAAECIAASADVSCAGDAGELVREILLRASEHPMPRLSPEVEERFHDNPVWGRPAARIPAARGLLFLARLNECADDASREALDRLSRDPVGAVRYQIAGELQLLGRTMPDVMWALVERFAREDTNRGVLRALVNGTLQHLAGEFVERSVGLVKAILDRIPQEARGAQAVRQACWVLLTHLYLWHGEGRCRSAVLSLVEAPLDHADELGAIAVSIRAPLTAGSVEEPDPKADSARSRAFDLLERVTDATAGEFHQVVAAHEGPPPTLLAEEELQHARALAQLLNSIATELYFASGALAEEQSLGTDTEERRLGDAERARFFSEARLVFEKLAHVGLPSVAHRLLETLEALIEVDPASVFLQVAQVVRSASTSALPFEVLAANLVVKLIERYLAEYPAVLRIDEAHRMALLDVLETFVHAGWPEARRLVYRLEEMYR